MSRAPAGLTPSCGCGRRYLPTNPPTDSVRGDTRLTLRSGLLFVMVVVVPTACSADPRAPTRNGVNDVMKACQIRSSWQNPTKESCINCLVATREPHCDCEAFKSFSGLCESQEEARRAEPSCTQAIEECARTCRAGDCVCVERCFAGADRCKPIVAARDGCVAEACETACR